MTNGKECKWFFPICSEGAHERGLNNAMYEHFKSQSQYTTLVREAIQNSLDAVLDESKPVVVKFSFLPLRNPFTTMPNLMDIRRYIDGCIKYWDSNSDIKKQYQPMIDYIDDSEDALSYLKVSDFNTRGMDYRYDDNNCTFFAFLRAEGTSVKNMINSGGSFGFGKMAYFGLSNFRTILVSTMNKNREVAFEGSAMLCTNKVDGVKYMDVGYYDTNNGHPITEQENIPELFRRSEPGTDINIMGISFDKEMMKIHKQEIVRAVLTHFWMAIHEKKLEVYMGGIRINKDMLNSLMLEYFPNKLDISSHYENPRTYYEVVIGAEEAKKEFKLYKDHIYPIGNCRFYIGRNRGSRDRYIAMRSPRMVVQAFNSQSSKGYSAVFICDDKEGNELLKITEPPAHDKWDRARVQDKSSSKHKLARKALTEVRNFALNCVTDFFQSAEQDVTEIRGLDQFLYNPSDENKSPVFSENVVSKDGEISNEYTDVENGAPIGSLDLLPKSNNENSNIGHITVKDTLNANKGGSDLSGKSDRSLKTKIANPKPRSGTSKLNTKKHQDENGESTNIEHPIQVRYRCFAQEESNVIVHKLVFYSEQNIDNVILRFKSATAEPQGLIEIPIIWSSIGETHENSIKEIHVVKGKNIVKFRFNDNLTHAVNLEAYYEEK